MKLRMYLYATGFVLLSTLSHAAPIVVRSGAHDGFSRLVLEVPPNTDWSIETAEKTTRIALSGHKDGFDIEDVFNRIGHKHIDQLVSSENFLDVNFSCRCELIAFEQGDKMIVLDIRALPGKPIPPQEPVPQPQVGFTPPQQFRFGKRITPSNTPQSKLLPTPKLKYVTNIPAVLNSRPTLNVPKENGTVTSDLTETQQLISEQMSAAATRGLLTPKAKPIDLPFVQTRPQINTQIFDSSTMGPSSTNANASPNGGNLKITSSSDIMNGTGMASISTTLGVRCIEPKVTAIEEWTSDLPFSIQVAELRKELFAEFDRLNQKAAVQLARTYLHFGFGLEAREVLALRPQLARNHPALWEIAEIMEYGHARRPHYLQHFMECDTSVSLWAILSKQSIAPAQNINTSAALRAVSALPMHLRTFIAPELSRRLLRYGAPDAAAAALRSIERTAQPPSSKANLAKADLEMARGNVSGAQDRLAQVVASNDEQSAEALIKFVDTHLAADAEIDQNVATLVEAYALQMRDDPMGAELRRAHVLALGKSGQFDAAFEALERVRERGDKPTDGPVASALFDLVARKHSDIGFLESVFQQMPLVQSVVESAVVLEIANRLVELGFALEAERILSTRSDIQNDDSARMIKAKIALALARPYEAEAVIFGLKTAEADSLRALAKAKSGAFDEAHRLFSRLGEEDEIRYTAWLSNDWANLVGQDTPVLGQIASLTQTQISEDPNPDGMLSRTREAISESTQARSMIEELLRVSNAETEIDP